MAVEPSLIGRERAPYNCHPDGRDSDLGGGVGRGTVGVARWKQILTSSIKHGSDELMTNPPSETIIFTF